jgi:hypothetical protein
MVTAKTSKAELLVNSGFILGSIFSCRRHVVIEKSDAIQRNGAQLSVRRYSEPTLLEKSDIRKAREGHSEPATELRKFDSEITALVSTN